MILSAKAGTGFVDKSGMCLARVRMGEGVWHVSLVLEIQR